MFKDFGVIVQNVLIRPFSVLFGTHGETHTVCLQIDNYSMYYQLSTTHLLT